MSSSRGLYPFVVVALVAGLLPMTVLARPTAETGRIEPALLEQLRIEGTASFFVKMAVEADLSAAYDIADWNERGEAVVTALREVARVSQAPTIDYARRHGLDYTSFLTTNSVLVRGGNLGSALDLAALPGVAYLRLERILEIPVEDSEPAPGVQGDETEGSAATATIDWGILDTKADQVWSQYGARGQDIVVGSIDTGVDYTHVALQPNYKCGAGPHTDCWLDPGTTNCQGAGGGPCEAFPALGYHGTHTLATAVATDDPALSYIAGMAPSAQWIACLGCPSGPAGCPEFDTNACADWMLAPGGDPANRPQVVNNSWGGGGGDLWFLPAVNAWRAAGIFPAFAAGNSGPLCATAVSPGSYQASVSTAAHDSNRLIAAFSSRGPSWYGHEPYTKPNISAPGVNIISAKPGNGWEAKSGTSTASPHTAGAVALVWSACPSYTGKVDQTFALLANTADSPSAGNCDAPPDGEGNYAYGYGYMNALAAVEQCSGVVFGTLQGRVLDKWGSPVQGAAVLAKPGQGGAGVQVTTDSSGDYALEIGPGTYVVTASKADYLPQTVSDVVVASGQTTVQDFALDAWGTLEGHVLDPSGSPVEGATVYIEGAIEGAGVQATTDPSGFYILQLLVGTYDATAYKVGFSTVTIPDVVVLTGQTTVQDFTLTQLAAPEAAFGAQPTSGVAPLIVQYTDESTGTISSWLWDFGDGTTGVTPNPVHAYGAPGPYTVSLTVSGPGGTDTLTRAGYILVYQAVDADFSGTPTSGLKPLTVAFTNTSTGDYTSSSWSFGDGMTSSEKNPSHTYPSAGSYKVTLTVSGPGGSDTLQRPNYVTVLVGRAHVSGIVLTYQRVSGKYKVTAKVTIVDQNNQVVPGATVYVTWTLPNNSSQSQQALTNTSGVAQFSVQSTLTGSYKICVTNVAKANWAYDPGQNVETCDTKTVP